MAIKWSPVQTVTKREPLFFAGSPPPGAPTSKTVEYVTLEDWRKAEARIIELETAIREHHSSWYPEERDCDDNCKKLCDLLK